MTIPQVSVIIPHYNDLEGLDICLTALGRQTFPPDRYEIIVADNASPVGESAVASLIAGRAKFISVAEKGAGPARNGGVAASRGGVLAFIDSDCQAAPDWLEQGVAALATHDFIGGHVRVLVHDEQAITPAEAFERVFAFDFKAYIEQKGFTGAGNMFCRRPVFDVVGGFRKGLSEDVDWSHRACASGFKLAHAPNVIVGHPARRTWADLLVKWKRVNAETYGLLPAKRGRLSWSFRCLGLPISALAHTPRVLRSNDLSTLSQRLAALSVLYRLRLWRSYDCFRLLFSNGRR